MAGKIQAVTEEVHLSMNPFEFQGIWRNVSKECKIPVTRQIDNWWEPGAPRYGARCNLV